MLGSIFIAGTVLLAALLVIATYRYVGLSSAVIALIGLTPWLLYVGVLSAKGVLSNPSIRPPGAFLVVVPAILFVIYFAGFSSKGKTLALSIPAGFLIAIQFFRVGVELGLHELWQQGLIPKLMTYEGGNVDIFIGVSAPVIAWLIHRGALNNRLALVWNILGLAALVNIFVRGVLTAPGPLNLIHSEVPNLAVGTFPFTFIAGFFAPTALMLHLLSIRNLRLQKLAETGQESLPN